MSCDHEVITYEYTGDAYCKVCEVSAQTAVDELRARVATAREEGRRAGLEEAALVAGLFVSRRFKDDVSALELEASIRALLDAQEAGK